MNNNEQQKQAEHVSIVSRFFSFMLALVTLKTDTSIAATTRRVNQPQSQTPSAKLLTVAAGEIKAPAPLKDSQPVPARAPTAAVIASVPQTQTSTPKNHPKSSSQNSASFFKTISAWYWKKANKSYAEDNALTAANPVSLNESMFNSEILNRFNGGNNTTPFGHPGKH